MTTTRRTIVTAQLAVVAVDISSGPDQGPGTVVVHALGFSYNTATDVLHVGLGGIGTSSELDVIAPGQTYPDPPVNDLPAYGISGSVTGAIGNFTTTVITNSDWWGLGPYPAVVSGGIVELSITSGPAGFADTTGGPALAGIAPGATWPTAPNVWDGPPPSDFNPAGKAVCWASTLAKFIVAGGWLAATPASVQHSADGQVWTAASHGTPFDNAVAGGAACVAWSPGLGLGVLGAFSATNTDPLIASTTDGDTWTTRLVSDSTDAATFAACWTGTKFIVGGHDLPLTASLNRAALTNSPDGITWTSRATPFDDAGFFTGTVYGLASDGAGNVIAVGQKQSGICIAWSTDSGDTWTEITGTTFHTQGTIPLCVATDGTRWVIGGGGSGYSTQWTTSPLGSWFAGIQPFDSGGTVSALMYVGYWVAGGFDANTIYTTFTARSPNAVGSVQPTALDDAVDFSAQILGWAWDGFRTLVGVGHGLEVVSSIPQPLWHLNTVGLPGAPTDNPPLWLAGRAN